MPLSSASVGRSGEPKTQRVDARWTMAHAAALGHAEAAFFDTAAQPDVLAHPLFPVCFEWPLLLSERHVPTGGLAPDERLRGVHASHDLVLHRPIRAGMEVTTRARVVRVEARRAGAYQLTRLESATADGAPLCTTWYGTVYRGVPVSGGDRREEGAQPPELEPAADDAETSVDLPIPAQAAHVYSECARIWNPIHTDAAVAARAGLPAIVLHGTATLGLAVSRAIERLLDGDAERVARIAGRFAATVALPSRCRVTIRGSRPPLRFEVTGEAGETVLRDGLVVAGPVPRPA